MDFFRSIIGKLFNLPAESMPKIAEWQLSFRSWNSVGWVLLLATVLGVLSFLSYRRAGAHVATVPRYLLAATRTLFLLLLLSLLLRPVLRFTLEGSIRRAMLVLIDSSQSMVTPEKRLDEADLKRAAIVKDVLDPTKGLEQSADKGKLAQFESSTRLDLMKAALTNPRLDLMNRLAKDYDLRPFTFGSTTAEVPKAKADPNDKNALKAGIDLAFVNSLKADAPSTPLGDAIKDLLGRSRGQPLAGIFILTDGQSNSGSPPSAAAELARQTNVPLYIYGVGISQPKDIALASIFSQDICFVDDEVPVVVRLRSTNLGGKQGKVTLKLGDQTVDTKDADLADDAEQVVSMQFTPKKPGIYDLTASADPLPEEANRTNNTDSKKIRVIDGKIKVLLVEQYPRWEFKYLQALLTRDRRVDLKTYLVEADPILATLPGSQYIKQIPAGKVDLIDKYDLVIIGDIDPRIISTGQLNDLSDFVNKFGGGLIVMPGRRYGPGAWRGTPMEKLLPIEVDTTRKTLRGGTDLSDSNERPIRLEVTPLGYDSPMLRLSDKAEESKKIWSKLPPIYWDAIVSRAKAGASVLMVDPDPSKASRNGKMPVIAMQQYGLGQVLYVGTDNTWRWRKNAADKYHATLWGQMVQRLSLPHLLGESKKTQLSADKKKYATGDKVTIYARLYTETFEPIVEKSVGGTYQMAAGRSPVPVTMRPLPEQPGLYRGEFIAPEAGTYNFSVDRDQKEKLVVNVDQPRVELGETALNEAVLKEIAGVTKGGYFREEDLYKMPDSTQAKTERVKSKLEVDIWSSPAYFLLLLAIVTAEWIGRKIVQLR